MDRRTSDSTLLRLGALVVVLLFIGVGIWWRVSGEPTGAGLAIAGVAAVCVLIAAAASFVVRHR